MSTITLYQFHFSHFCEKVRWALDHKGLAYTCRNLLPGPHLAVTRKLAPRTAVPILVVDGTVLQDSTSILTFLDERFPERPLTPADPQDAQAALAWEGRLDEEIGVLLRRWFYFHALPDRPRAQRFLLDGAPWYGRPLYALIFPAVRAAMTKAMDIHAASAAQAEAGMLAALESLDRTLAQRRYLVGDRFTRADLTACALLSPYCAPGRVEADVAAWFPARVRELRDAHRARPFFQWVRETYAMHRHGARGAYPAVK